MTHFLRRLWRDEAGFVVSAELVLIASILVIGLIVGLASLRDAVVGELADVAQAIGRTDQSYGYLGLTNLHATIAGASFNDALDFCDQAADATGPNTFNVGILTIAPSSELTDP